MSEHFMKAKTAAELMAMLEADPDWVKRREEREEQARELEAQSRAEQEQLLKDLKEVGTEVESVWDLVNTSNRYEKAVPVLLEHLRRPYSDGTVAGIARALAVPDARCAWGTLVEEYKKTPNNRGNSKDALAVAVAATTTVATIDQLIPLVLDPSLGDSRLLLLRPLRKSKNPQAKQVLEQLASDPVFAKEIGSWKPRKRPETTP